MAGSSGSGGIDDRSSAADVLDALGRVGMDLGIHRADDGTWHAQAIALDGPPRESQLVGEGTTADEAARAVWERYLAVQDGIGTS